MFAGKYDGAKVFSATKQKERENLGDQVTRWIETNRDKYEIVATNVTQSSDSEYHCLTIMVFFQLK